MVPAKGCTARLGVSRTGDAVSWWDWLVANGSGISALAAGIGALAAVTAARIAWSSLRQTARDSRDRSRPVVVVELGYHPNFKRALEIKVHNAGASLARNVRLTFDPALPTEASDRSRYGAYAARMFASPLRTFAPGQMLSNPWWANHDQSAPAQCDVTATYEDAHGQRYSDIYVLDVEPYMASLFIEPPR